MSMTSEPTIYWAVIRDKIDRVEYIELEELGNNKWGAVLGLDEFTFVVSQTDPDFFDVLSEALAVRKTL